MNKYINYLAKILLSVGCVCGLGMWTEAAAKPTRPIDCPEEFWDGTVCQHSGSMDDSSGDVTTTTCTSLPSLQHFTITASTYADDKITLTLAPTGAPRFYLHIALTQEGGKDILSTWCTGDETLCKTVGNGKACLGNNYTGWCYSTN